MDKLIISKNVELTIDIEKFFDKTMDTITNMFYDTLYEYHFEDVFTDEEIYSIRWNIASAVAETILKER